MADPVGWFHFDPPAQITADLPCWRVTTPHLHIARDVSRLLGGVWYELKSETDQWELLTEATRTSVVVEAVRETLSFRLASRADLGIFALRINGWTLRDVMGDVADRISEIQGKVHGELYMEYIDFAMRNQIYARYVRPVLNLSPMT
ncbi:hypothetical protein [Streptomyces sp. NPDC059479]|uniref:hypothetical protein n=1 Tax=Streptomyces sp. NPDC059479 TaxID=3346848 RepID=UPI00369227CE